jgi:ketosteroid isomerase-like protein
MWSSKTVVALACGLGIVILTANGLLSVRAAEEERRAAPVAKAEKPEKPLTAAQKEIVAAFQAYVEAVAHRDIDRAMAAFAPGPDTIVLGTGKDETWGGPEEIRDAHLHFFKTYEKETVEPVWRQIKVSGDLAWYAGMSRFVDESKGKKNEFFMNISAVLQKENDKWQIVLLHISNPTGPEKQG